MAKVWITYAWTDNEDHDVDYIAQELRQSGLIVQIDRWTLKAGERLWSQIENFIQDPAECDAWLLYATQASLSSEPCMEEYAYALDRALGSRGQAFPIIGLFPSHISPDLMPAGIRTRLYVSTTDRSWKERVKAAAEGRSPTIDHPILEPYNFGVHSVNGGYLLEVRPRAGVWFPFQICVPLHEKEQTIGRHVHFVFGAPGCVPDPPNAYIVRIDGQCEGTWADRTKWWIIDPTDEVTPVKSIFLFVAQLPSEIMFGQRGGTMHRQVLAA